MVHDTVGALAFTRSKAPPQARALMLCTARWCLLSSALALSCQAFAPNEPPSVSSPPPLAGILGPPRAPPASGVSEFVGRAGSGGAGAAGSGGRGGSASNAVDDAGADASVGADAAADSGALDSGLVVDAAP